ncbi:hypothetical protein J2X02_001399 [Pseudoxanthomonas japonensis]|uniref:hypothetical protein n=1 Tax=Pseudoxanthomonas TaxID=83618 RepID=UPI000783991B|nr:MULTISPECIES: hypothetical protein [Pseudoxanthomonas]MBL8257828.1 hypothetical protein [Pseudoxanthomonas mexicana]MDR7068582.1 hypothetical protein [Pseudoxanthomonas japonensis]
MIGYVLVTLMLVAYLHNYLWISGLKRAIAREHARHPEIDQFRSLAPPYQLVLNLIRFKHSRALQALPADEQKLQHLYYRFQLFILASIPISIIYAVAYLAG